MYYLQRPLLVAGEGVEAACSTAGVVVRCPWRTSSTADPGLWHRPRPWRSWTWDSPARTCSSWPRPASQTERIRPEFRFHQPNFTATYQKSLAVFYMKVCFLIHPMVKVFRTVAIEWFVVFGTWRASARSSREPSLASRSNLSFWKFEKKSELQKVESWILPLLKVLH